MTLPLPSAELAIAAMEMSRAPGPSSAARLTRAVEAFDRAEVPVSHRALFEAARIAIDAAPDEWPRHAETLNERVRELRTSAKTARWAERKDLQ